MENYNKHLRILFVIPGYEPAWAFGGTTTGQRILARALAAIGHDVSVYATNADGLGGVLDVPVEIAVDLGGVQVIYFPCLPFGPRREFYSRRMMKALQRNVKQFDIVYLISMYQLIGLKASHICAKAGVPVVHHIAGALSPYILSRGRFRKLMWWEIFNKRSLKRCTALHLTGVYEREQTAHILEQFRTYLVPNCIDCTHFKPRPDLRGVYRRKFGIDENIPLLVSVGRIDSKKRLDILIQAVAETKRGGYHFGLLIAGNDEVNLAISLKNMAEDLEVSERIVWTGLLSGDDVLGVYAAGDLFIQLSMDENFAIVVAEAMATGLPILVTPGVGVWYEINDGDVGRCVSLNSDSVAQGIMEFLDHREEWAGMGIKAVSIAERQFDAPKVAKLMTRAFWDVIESASSPECRWYLPDEERISTERV